MFTLQETKNRSWAKTPLIKAAKYGKFEMLKLLTELGADINKKDASTNQTVILMAVYSKNEECVKYLIDNGANLNVASSDHICPSTALLMAIDNLSDVEFIELFNGEDGQTEGTESSERIQTLKLRYEKEMRIFDLLLSKDADPNFCLHDDDGNNQFASDDDGLGRTPLMRVAQMNNINIPSLLLHQLLEHGACVNQTEKTIRNYTDALQCAIDARHSGIVQSLIEHGADTNTIFPYNGWYKKQCYLPAWEAWINGDYETTKYLMLGGCKVEPILVQAIEDRYLVQTDQQRKPQKRKPLTFSGSQDIMLNGNLILCQDELEKEILDQEEFDTLKWLYNFTQQPRQLTYLCRTYLRQDMAMIDASKVDTLPLPTALKDYILCKCLLE